MKYITTVAIAKVINLPECELIFDRRGKPLRLRGLSGKKSHGIKPTIGALMGTSALGTLSMHVRMMVAIFASFLFAASAAAQTQRARVDLIADVSAVKAGQPFTVGLHFRMDPKWHIYWSNPGAAGIPTRVKWTLPDGASAGPLQFPVPMKFVQPGDIVGYGYEDEVLLMATITPPAGQMDGTLQITADVSWLCCVEVCIPGRQTLDLSLPVKDQAAPAHTDLFSQWAARLPRPASAPDTDYVEQVEVTSQPSAEGASEVRATVTWKRSPAEIAFYPGGHKALDVSEPNVQPLGSDGSATDGQASSTVVQATVRPWPGQKQWPESLEGVLVYKTSDGEERGIQIPMPTPALPAGPAASAP